MEERCRERCRDCSGQGLMIIGHLLFPCDKCNGKGYIEVKTSK